LNWLLDCLKVIWKILGKDGGDRIIRNNNHQCEIKSELSAVFPIRSKCSEILVGFKKMK
jgi:hypothetical protein